MNFAIAVFNGPQTSQAPLSALNFARATVDAGHELSRVFFYHDGVYTANQLAVPPQDEANVCEGWSKFGLQNNIELIVCVASALRRGILDDTEASRYEKPTANLLPGFTIAGLGQLIDSNLSADRVVTFK